MKYEYLFYENRCQIKYCSCRCSHMIRYDVQKFVSVNSVRFVRRIRETEKLLARKGSEGVTYGETGDDEDDELTTTCEME